MANLFDYLEWRGDLTFEQAPFNHVDNLILSCLGYVVLDELEDCFPSGTTVEDEFNAGEITRSIDRFLENLDRENRIMFVRRYWHSDSIADLAELFKTSKHNISVRLSRTREKLKKHLIKEGVAL